MSYRRFLPLLLLLVQMTPAWASPVTEWAIWGPGWSRAGLGVSWYSREGLIQPQPGDMGLNRGWVGKNKITWQYLKTEDGQIDWLSPQVPEVYEKLKKSHLWAGASVYAHTYIWSDHAQPALIQRQIQGGGAKSGSMVM
ncbi:hypothetical protein JYU15_00710 [bacterium AH-315-I18]|nr:hypothetical protein [bacterium AH-315-I18]